MREYGGRRRRGHGRRRQPRRDDMVRVLWSESVVDVTLLLFLHGECMEEIAVAAIVVSGTATCITVVVVVVSSVVVEVWNVKVDEIVRGRRCIVGLSLMMM